MKTRHVLAATLILITLAAAVVPASAAVEPVVTNEWIELSGGTLNPCTDEWVELSGLADYVFSLVQHETGAGTLEEHMNMRATGVGATTGRQYQFLAVGNDHFTWAFDDAPSTHSNIYRSQVVTPGAKNNDVYWQRVHVTVNADGTVTAEIDESGFECR